MPHQHARNVRDQKFMGGSSSKKKKATRTIGGGLFDSVNHRAEKETAAQFNQPYGVVVDGDGNVIVADVINHCIRNITPQGHVSTLAGTGKGGHRNGKGTVSQFSYPGVAVDGDGNIIVADACNCCIRKITPQGQVSTLAGTTGEKGHRDGEGAGAQFNQPYGVAVDGDGSIIVADMHNHCIRNITPTGQVSTLAGTGKKGYRDGEGTEAQFNYPKGTAVDKDRNVFVADQNNFRIRKITPQGQVSTLTGTGETGHRDGEGTVSQFNYPSGVAVDGDGNVVVADLFNYRIRKVSPQGRASTLAGSGDEGHQDGFRVASAQVNQPSLCDRVSEVPFPWLRRDIVISQPSSSRETISEPSPGRDTVFQSTWSMDTTASQPLFIFGEGADDEAEGMCIDEEPEGIIDEEDNIKSNTKVYALYYDQDYYDNYDHYNYDYDYYY
jgi:sugar lactone lactonase YvrE